MTSEAPAAHADLKTRPTAEGHRADRLQSPDRVSAANVPAPLEQLRETLSKLVDDPAARGRSPAYQVTRDLRLCPSTQLRVLHWLVSGVEVEPDAAESLLWLLDRCVSGGCFEAAADTAAFEDAVRQARAVFAQMAGTRQAMATRARSLQPVAPYVTSPSVLRIPKLRRDRGEFDVAGQALTEGEVRGRVMLYADPIGRSLRPDIADAAIRLLARAGYDVDVPPVEVDCGWVPDWLGEPVDAVRQMAATVARWELTLERADADDRPEPVRQILTLGIAEAEFVTRMPARLSEVGLAASSELVAMMRSAVDITAWLRAHEIGPPTRWSSLRIGLLGAGDAKLRRINGEPRIEAVAALIRDAGYSVRPVHSPWTASGGTGLMPWLATDFTDKLRRAHLARVRPGSVDVVVVEEAGCQAVLAQVAPCPVVHVAEIMDWAYGGPVPSGLERFKDASVDVAKPVETVDRPHPVSDAQGSE